MLLTLVEPDNGPYGIFEWDSDYKFGDINPNFDTRGTYIGVLHQFTDIYVGY